MALAAAALFILAAPAARALPDPPCYRILQDLKTWSWLSEPERLVIQEAEKELKAMNWPKAADLSESLLEAAPKDIFSSPPALPIIEIRASGSKAKPVPPTQVDGWRWRLETAWLYAYGRDFDGAFRRFDYVRTTSFTKTGLAAEGQAFCRTRQRRYQEAKRILEESGVLAPSVATVLALAQRGRDDDWMRLRAIALNEQASPGENSPAPTLSGPIGRGQTLPSVAQPLLPKPKPSAESTTTSARIEAALILGEAWAAKGPGEPRSDLQPADWMTADKSRLGQALMYINRILSTGKAMTHHWQAARNLSAIIIRGAKPGKTKS